MVRPSSRTSSAVTSDPPLWKSVRFVSAETDVATEGVLRDGDAEVAAQSPEDEPEVGLGEPVHGDAADDEVSVAGVELLGEADKPGAEGREGEVRTPHAEQRQRGTTHGIAGCDELGEVCLGQDQKRVAGAAGVAASVEPCGVTWSAGDPWVTGWEVGAGIATSLWVAEVLSTKVGLAGCQRFTEVDDLLIH